MNNYALYYPTIEFSDFEWLWGAALLWDRIYRIVPSGYKPADCENVRILAEAGEIGVSIHPDDYAASIAGEFVAKMESRRWDAAAVTGEIPEEYARLHKDKVDVKLREMIIATGNGAMHDEWLHVPTQFEALYMTYLANHIADANNLQLLSDSTAAWTGSTYFRFDGDVQDFPSQGYLQQLAVLVLRDFLPENVLAIAPDEIIHFREKYRDERTRFLTAIQQSAASLSGCDDAGVVADRIEDLKRGIESSLKDYRKAIESLNIGSLTGIKSLTIPIATTVAANIAEPSLDPSKLTVVSGLGIGIGLVSGLIERRQKRRKLDKESDYSYLVHLGREWKGRSRYGNDYNYYLCRQMEEFIND